MRHRYLDIATTPSVREARRQYGSEAAWTQLRRDDAAEGPVTHERLGKAETAFIEERDGFYIASVSQTGWPYLQFRGGPAGFLRVIDDRTIGFADFRGNRQYLTVGNVRADERVSIFLMDYAHRRRLKIFGRMSVIDARDDPSLVQRLAVADYPATIERAVLVAIEAHDWNCPQHITPRFTEAELRAMLTRPETLSG